MSARAGVLAIALTAVLGFAGLLLAAGSDGRSTAFSLDIPPSIAVAVVRPGQTVCQGPINTTAAFDSVTPWISPSDASGTIPNRPLLGAAVDLTVRDAVTNAALARGQIAAGYVRPIDPIVSLDQKVSSGRRVRVCLRSHGPGIVDVMGAPVPNQALAEDDGTASGHLAIALLFLRQPRSLLSLVPTIFGRASLFRPGWVGPWTYWVLSAAFLGAFVLAGVAVTRALRSDKARRPLQGDPSE